ncbi:CBS domain-containing protein [Desulfolutivibrio sulfoxidireducens]|uniref:CBS domain-containing protein n=1 Tax=Desulfolutivibrio sulfoxidireducens TaxID=2773299 RepID=UPI00159E8394|nr:CBS domain-containing protein [Desulfolutivibrio sulfoxidireducens]QLA20725.1 CBS domain-containing protein [Desulfolutivibrio sulfoxidireducens]
MFRKRLGDIHSRGVVAADTGMNVRQAATLMRERALSCLPVLQAGRPVGIITERGLLRAAVRDPAAAAKSVSEVMSFPVLTAPPDMPAHEAYTLLQQNRLRHLVVIDAAGLALGVVSQSDLVQHLGYEYFVELRRLSRIMVRQVVTAPPDIQLSEALRIMAHKGISCLVAVRDGEPVGIITERDATGVILAGETSREMPLRDVMRSPVITAREDVPVHEGLSAMRRSAIRRLVVVDASGRLAGLVTQSDVVNAMEWEYIGVLKDIIREKEQSYRTIFANAVEGIFQTSLDGRFLEANPAMARMLGYDAPGDLAAGVLDIETQVYADPGKRAEVLSVLSRQNEPYTFETRFLRRDGSPLWVSCTARLVRDFQGRPDRVEGICLDVSERKRADETLSQSESRYRSIVEDQTELICRYRPDGRLSFVNEAYARYFGKHRRELLNVNFIPHIPAEDLAMIAERVGRIGPDAPVVAFEHRILMPDASVRWQRWTHRGIFDEAGHVVEYQAVGNDVTERKLAEQALERARDELEARVAVRTAELASANENLRQEIAARATAQQRLKENAIFLETILDTIQGGICVLDVDMNVLKVNAAMRAMCETGQPLEGRKCYQAFRGRAGPCPSCPTLRAMADGRMHSETVSRGDDEGRAPGCIELFAYPFHDDLGRVMGAVEFVRDITERKRLEEELLRAMRRTEAANRAKSRFLANMSHEIRTPLNAVLGYIQLVLNDTLSPTAAKRLQVAEESAQNLLSVINDILDYSKIEAGKFDVKEQSVDPREIVSSLVKQQDVLAGNKGLVLSLEVFPDVPARVFVDPMRLTQLVLNLISNAIKYTEQGGVRVEVSRERGAEAGAEGQENDWATLVFAVIDTGIGIPEESRDAVFESFTQIDSSLTKKYAGTGLGLAICKKIAGLLGGGITFESRVGHGSTFRFRVPLRVDRSLDRPSGGKGRDIPPAGAGPAGGAYKVLVVEDNRINRMFAEDMLASGGHAVVTAEDGCGALDILARETFDVVLMDIQMPVMDGLAATRAIRAGHGGIDPAIPVIGLSAYALDRERERFLEAGLDDYITKPVNIEAFFEAVGRVLRTRAAPVAPRVAPRAAPEGPTSSSRALEPGDEADMAGVIDCAGLMAQYGRKKELLRMIGDELFKAMPRCVADMKTALAAGDMATFARLAHTLRGNAAMFGARELRRQATLAEEAAGRGDHAQAARLFPVLSRHIDLVVHALQAFLTRAPW